MLSSQGSTPSSSLSGWLWAPGTGAQNRPSDLGGPRRAPQASGACRDFSTREHWEQAAAAGVPDATAEPRLGSRRSDPKSSQGLPTGRFRQQAGRAACPTRRPRLPRLASQRVLRSEMQQEGLLAQADCPPPPSPPLPPRNSAESALLCRLPEGLLARPDCPPKPGRFSLFAAARRAGVDPAPRARRRDAVPESARPRQTDFRRRRRAGAVCRGTMKGYGHEKQSKTRSRFLEKSGQRAGAVRRAPGSSRPGEAARPDGPARPGHRLQASVAGSGPKISAKAGWLPACAGPCGRSAARPGGSA